VLVSLPPGEPAFKPLFQDCEKRAQNLARQSFDPRLHLTVQTTEDLT